MASVLKACGKPEYGPVWAMASRISVRDKPTFWAERKNFRY